MLRLLTGAEELRIKKPLLTEHGGGLREFSVEEFGLFDNVMDEKVFLSTSERSNIVYHFLMSIRAHREDSAMCCSIKFTEGQCMSKLYFCENKRYFSKYISYSSVGL
ncbi:unnamed protein product [Trichobilharzia regenti]|nr:unnamed protein product [Trichobilharzia regenti]